MPVETTVKGVLTAAVFTGFEPFVFERDGELAGMDVDILARFCAEARLELRLRPEPVFEGIWFRPAAGEFDLAAAGIACFPERTDPRIAWSAPYLEVERSILVAEDNAGHLRSIADFAGRAIGFVRASSADLDTRERAPPGTRLVPLEDQRQGMALLRAGDIDGLAMGGPSNSYNRRLHADFRLIDVHRMRLDEGLRFPLKASLGELREALDRFITEARDNGTIAAIFERWLPAHGG